MRLVGLEPYDNPIKSRVLCQLSYKRVSGVSRARTYDLLLVRQTLSQLSYNPKVGGVGFEPTKPKQQIYSLPPLTAWIPSNISNFKVLNDLDGIRTRDLRRDRAAR